MNTKRFIDWLKAWQEMFSKFLPGQKFIDTSRSEGQYFQMANELSIAVKNAESGDEVAAQRAKHLRAQMYLGSESEERIEDEGTRRWREHNAEASDRAQKWRENCSHGPRP